MKAFSREALEHYIPVIREEVRRAVKDWMQSESCVLVYPETKRLMFRIAMRILLGFNPEQIKTDEQELVEAFEEMIKNLFSLPIDVPFSGLYRVCVRRSKPMQLMLWQKRVFVRTMLFRIVPRLFFYK